jgi:hypothetical protein
MLNDDLYLSLLGNRSLSTLLLRILGIGALVHAQMPIRQRPYLCRYSIHKIAIVRHENDRSLESEQRLF